MKIAILTQPLKTNFGGILQDYALQQVLKRLGHEPVTIDYDCRYTKGRWMLGKIKSIFTGTSHHIQFPTFNRSGQENLNRFIHDHITMTKPVDKPTREIFDRIHPDAVVVGSDQVWAPACNVPIDYLGNMFLDFAPDFKGKRMAYAASFGGGEWTYTPEWTEKCSRLAKKFDAISVREESGVKLCKEHLDVDAKHVLDPTLLLAAEDYMQLLPTNQVQSDYLFAYILDTTAEKKAFLQKVADKFGLRLVIKGANDDLKWEDSIEGWLSDIKNAAFVVTDSFHGSVFSILFHRPFLSIINNKRGADRFTSLLDKLGLLDRLVNETTKIEDISNEINWQVVEDKLEVEREVSMNYLKEAL
ncbi:Polysaccharide pyruvyl transferase [Bacteroidales bacterium KHT7]|nr:Polysaccharide pyruvyl transferase [Bacteroidales bacterium KHT7]